MRIKPQFAPLKTPGLENAIRFTAAIRLVDRVQVHASVLADGRPVLTASPPSGEAWRSYYYSGGQRIAMRVQVGSGDEVFYLLGDHLGSTTITADESGTFYSEMRYEPWGEVWYDSADNSGNATPTDFTYTGQRSNSYIKLIHMGARWYDPAIGRFISADTIVPGVGNPLAWDRYHYALNSPIMFKDPSGHIACNDPLLGGSEICDEENPTLFGDVDGPYTPPPKYDYGCEPPEDCVTEDDDPIEQIVRTVWGEGGNQNAQIAANVLQTIMHRAQMFWQCSSNSRCQNYKFLNPEGIPWSAITGDQLTALILFILSEPYATSEGPRAAYNAWDSPYSNPSYGSAQALWDDISGAVSTLLANPGINSTAAPISVGGVKPSSSISSNPNVMFYGAGDYLDLGAADMSYVHYDQVGVRRQYYTTYAFDPKDYLFPP